MGAGGSNQHQDRNEELPDGEIMKQQKPEKERPI